MYQTATFLSQIKSWLFRVGNREYPYEGDPFSPIFCCRNSPYFKKLCRWGSLGIVSTTARRPQGGAALSLWFPGPLGPPTLAAHFPTSWENIVFIFKHRWAWPEPFQSTESKGQVKDFRKCSLENSTDDSGPEPGLILTKMWMYSPRTHPLIPH